MADPRKGGLHGGGRPLQHLQVDVGAAHQRAGDVVAGVAAPRVAEDAVEHALVEAEGLRGVDELRQRQLEPPDRPRSHARRTAPCRAFAPSVNLAFAPRP